MNIYIISITILSLICIALILKIRSLRVEYSNVDKYKKESEGLRHSCNAFKHTIKGLEQSYNLLLHQLTAANLEATSYRSRMSNPEYLKRKLEELSNHPSQEQQ